MIARALSLWQPWAFAIMRLGKRLENRGRVDGRVPLNAFTGPLLLHASKRWPSVNNVGAMMDLLRELPVEIEESNQALARIQNSLGCIVGQAKIVRWVFRVPACKAHGEIWLDQNRTLLDEGPPADQLKWFAGPWAAVLEDVVEFETPVRCVGRQGIWTVPPEAAEACAAAKVRRDSTCTHCDRDWTAKCDICGAPLCDHCGKIGQWYLCQGCAS